MNKRLYTLKKLAEEAAAHKCPMKQMMEAAAPAIAEEGLPLEHVLKESPHESTTIMLSGNVDPEEVEKIIEGLGMPEQVAENAEEAIEEATGKEEPEGEEKEEHGEDADKEGGEEKEEKSEDKEEEEEDMEKEASARLEFALSEILWGNQR